MKETDFNLQKRKTAIVDIGANSVRMNIYDVDLADGSFSVCDSARSMLGLAAYSVNGELSSDGEGKLFALLREYLARANSIPADDFFAFATASLRGLSNSGKIIETIKRKLGIEIKIISGSEEAALDFEATMAKFSGTLPGRGVMIDMGGGSTEIVCFENRSAVHSVSLPIGCLALSKKYVLNPPCILRDEKDNILNYVREVLNGIPDFADFASTAFLIGGTARAAAKITAAIENGGVVSEGNPFSAKSMQNALNKLAEDDNFLTNTVKKYCPDRKITVIPGMTALNEIICYVGAKTLITSNAGVREGFLIKTIREMRENN